MEKRRGPRKESGRTGRDKGRSGTGRTERGKTRFGTGKTERGKVTFRSTRSEGDKPGYGNERRERNSDKFKSGTTEPGNVRSESGRPQKGKVRFESGKTERSKGRFGEERTPRDKPGYESERTERSKEKFKSEKTETGNPRSESRSPLKGKVRFESGERERSKGRFAEERTPDDKPRYESEGTEKDKDKFKTGRTNRGKGRYGRGTTDDDKPKYESGRSESRNVRFESDRREKKTFSPQQNPKPFRDRTNKKDFIPHMSDEAAAKGIQLNKYLSNSGIASRRKCEELIENGLVTVNDKEVLESGYRVQKDDVVKFKGERVFSARKYYVLLNKPKDFITTTSDELGRKTVMELIEKAAPERLYPVGRLDRNTTGLLLFTNDGELAQKLTHPSKQIKKVYEVTLNKELEEEDMQKIAAGIELEDGVATVDEIAFAHAMDKSVVGIELHIGKNRIVRRIFEKLGYDVVKLDRVLYAGLTKKNLQRGHWRPLTEKEIRTLKYFS
jgi:23S rRNA pseudouridine2605 synthase